MNNVSDCRESSINGIGDLSKRHSVNLAHVNRFNPSLMVYLFRRPVLIYFASRVNLIIIISLPFLDLPALAVNFL